MHTHNYTHTHTHTHTHTAGGQPARTASSTCARHSRSRSPPHTSCARCPGCVFCTHSCAAGTLPCPMPGSVLSSGRCGCGVYVCGGRGALSMAKKPWFYVMNATATMCGTAPVCMSVHVVSRLLCAGGLSGNCIASIFLMQHAHNVCCFKSGFKACTKVHAPCPCVFCDPVARVD